jgi:F1F0 ATPase subunit 2
MNEALTLALAGLAGLSLGGIFFGGLWWTVRKGVASRRPALWFSASLLLRTGIVVAGFYFVGRNDWQPLLLCLLGFAMARPVVTWLTRRLGEHPTRPTEETSHAP